MPNTAQRILEIFRPLQEKGGSCFPLAFYQAGEQAATHFGGDGARRGGLFKPRGPTSCENFWGSGGEGGGGSAGQPPGSPGGGGGRWVPQHTYLKMIPLKR